MLFSWFETKKSVDFANDLAVEFQKRISPDDLANPTTSIESRLRGAKDLMMSRTQVFAERNSLNLLSRARLANTLQWKLKEFGYADDMVQTLVREVTKIVTLVKVKKIG